MGPTYTIWSPGIGVQRILCSKNGIPGGSSDEELRRSEMRLPEIAAFIGSLVPHRVVVLSQVEDLFGGNKHVLKYSSAMDRAAPEVCLEFFRAVLACLPTYLSREQVKQSWYCCRQGWNSRGPRTFVYSYIFALSLECLVKASTTQVHSLFCQCRGLHACL